MASSAVCRMFLLHFPIATQPGIGDHVELNPKPQPNHLYTLSSLMYIYSWKCQTKCNQRVIHLSGPGLTLKCKQGPQWTINAPPHPVNKDE